MDNFDMLRPFPRQVWQTDTDTDDDDDDDDDVFFGVFLLQVLIRTIEDGRFGVALLLLLA